MRVLVVGDAASINVRRWCEGLLREDMDVAMLSFEAGWRPDIPVKVLPSFGLRAAARYVVAIPLARRWASRHSPDLVVGYFASGYGTIARGTGKRPLVQVTAGLDVIDNPEGTVRHWLTRRNLAAADLVIAWARHMGEAVMAFGVPAERILVQPRGIPLAGYRPQPNHDSESGARVIVTRALEPVYRHDDILTAIAMVDTPPLQLTVAGDGSLRDTLEARARGLGVKSRVRFVGHVPNDQLPALLSEHDVYVSARPHDGVSASLLEAMAAGLVPVVPDHPANRDWIQHGRTGLLVRAVTSELATALQRAASDATLRRTAATVNPDVVARRGDIDANMRLIAARLRELADR